MVMSRYLIFLTVLLSYATCGLCWEANEMQMFDLVEELNDTNFYQFLNVSNTASAAEIRRAYRRLSLTHHPDKNIDNPDANKIFQRIVAVYEILKDAKLREKYDDVLKNGLPTWRQPVFYYRQLRKMGIAETLFLVFVISIIGHYLVMWAYYLEHKLNMEEVLSSAYKKNKARKKQKDVVDSAIQEELDTIPRPRILDIWPVALTCGTYHFIRNFPVLCSEVKEMVKSQIDAYFAEKQKAKEEIENLKRLEEERELKKELKKKRKKEKAEQIRSSMHSVAGDAPVVYNPVLSMQDNDEKAELKSGPWTDADYVLLTNAMAKFPPGVPERWQRIADKVGRAVEEVTAKAKAIRENGGIAMSENVQNSLDGVQANVLNGRVGGGITLRQSAFEVNENEVCGSSSEDEEEFETARQRRQAKRRKKRQPAPSQPEPSDKLEMLEEEEEEAPAKEEPKKAPEVAFPDSVSKWSQEEQKLLEAALRKFPKGTHERWDRIAGHVRLRNKTECMDRFRYLTSIVKAKSQ